MLTAATILMLPGTDAANIRYPSSERTESSGDLFAKSFDESSALTGEMKPEGADRKETKNIVGSENLVLMKSESADPGVVVIKAKSDLGVAKRASVSTLNAKSQGTVQSADEIKKTIISELPQTEAKPSSGSSVTTLTVMPANTKDGVQTVDPTHVDSTAVDGKGKLVALPATEIVSLSPNSASNDVAAAKQNLKHLPAPAPNHAASPTKETKTHEVAGKAGRSAKVDGIKDKTVKIAEVATDTAVPTVLVVPVTGLSLNPTTQGSSKVSDDASLPSASAESVTSVGPASAKGAKPGKNSAVTEKSDDGSKKADASILDDDSAARKPDVDATKTTPSISKAVDIGNSKIQNTATPGGAGGSTHVDPKVADVGFGMSSGTSTHIAATGRVQVAETRAHQAATQGDSVGLDGGGSIDATHRTLAATPTSLEVGVANGSHGWLKIRAEMADGGVVNASLSPATSSGQEMLHKELPSLTAYLQSERVAVNNVAIQPTVISGSGTSGFERGMSGNGQGQPSQSGGQGGDARQAVVADAASSRAENDTKYGGTNGIGGEGLLSSVTHFGGGNWLNVRV